jgi:hypothetical protein
MIFIIIVSRKNKNREHNDTLDPKDDTFIISMAKFTCLFEGKTSSRVDIDYKMIQKTTSFHAFYPYLYYFYILENTLEVEPFIKSPYIRCSHIITYSLFTNVILYSK